MDREKSFEKLKEDPVVDKADHIFSSTVDISLALSTTRKAQRLLNLRTFTVALANEGVSVYSKADKESTVVGTTPPGMKVIRTNYSTQGLNNDGSYWHVLNMQKGLFPVRLHS